jgi:hypothetical protein
VQQDSLVRSHAQYWALAIPVRPEAAYQRTVEHGVSAAVAEEVLAAASKAGPWDRRILWRNCSTDPAAPDPAASGARHSGRMRQSATGWRVRHHLQRQQMRCLHHIRAIDLSWVLNALIGAFWRIGLARCWLSFGAFNMSLIK